MGVGALCRPSGPGNLNSSLVLLKEAPGWKLLWDWDSVMWVSVCGILQEEKKEAEASWQSGKATEMDADDQLEADWGTF